jgi:small basic protein (TIGR04137 family)
MSLDPSLKSASSLVRHRNVLTRDERLARLKDEEKWPEGRSVFGLPKVANRKAAVGKAVKEEAEEGAAGATPAAGAAPAAKGAAPAAKGAAPAKAPAAPGAKGGAGATAAPAKKK